MIYNNIILSHSLKKVEKTFFDKYNVDSKVLMENAANALLSVIIEYINKDDKICFVCGSGNNGGDGYACAGLLYQMGYNVCVICNELPKTIDCLYYYNKYISDSAEFYDYSIDEDCLDILFESDIIVDCLYGIGFKGTLNEKDISIVNIINDSKAFVISCDVPSGTIADLAEIGNCAVCADVTVVFTALKASNVSYPAFEYNGKVILKDIGIPKEILDNVSCDDIIIISDIHNNHFPKRNLNSHKGTFGTLVMYCGSENMIGAAVFAARAALRCGVGLIKLSTEDIAIKKLQTKLNDVVFCNISDHIETGSAYLLGCGLSRSLDCYIENILLGVKNPIVIDADGINYLSTHIDVLRNMTAKKILTPHPAEMARLLNVSVSEVNMHRISFAKDFAKKFNCIVVLKGAKTIIASPNKVAINMSGSDSLAKGGSGDMLAGIIGAYLSMGVELFDAARLGCYFHGIIGENSSYHESIDEMIDKIT